jgi:hypothetical protein
MNLLIMQFSPAYCIISRLDPNIDPLYSITTDGQSTILPWCQDTPGTLDELFSFPILIIFRLLRFLFIWGALSDERTCMYEVNSCCLASQVQSFSGPSPVELITIFLLSQIWDSPNLYGQLPVFISSRKRVAQLYP